MPARPFVYTPGIMPQDRYTKGVVGERSLAVDRIWEGYEKERLARPLESGRRA